jgi:peptidoglycan-N-acetylglucosamine deacetylase
MRTLKFIIVVTLIFYSEFYFSFKSEASENLNPEGSISQKEKIVALTFDDGPHRIYTNKILDILEEYQAKATFFVLGRNVLPNKETLQRIVLGGNEIGNHTWSHFFLPRLNQKKIKQEIAKTQRIIKETTGYITRIFRPPYGYYNHFVSVAIGMPIVLWKVDPQDWKSKNAIRIADEVLKKTDNCSIILLHDSHASTVEAVKVFLPKLHSSGFIFVTVSELNQKCPNKKH